MIKNRPYMRPGQYPIQVRRQDGATLIVALIMLILLTMLGLSSVNLGNSNLQVVGNMQQRNEVINAAQSRIETVISSNDFSLGTVPASVTDPVLVDARGTGVPDVRVTIAPPVATKCAGAESTISNLVDTSAYPVSTQAEIDAKAAQDRANLEETMCVPTQAQNPDGSTTKVYPCRDAVWEISATAEDLTTGAKVTQSQGIAVRKEGACT
jgi:PilX N-terminal